MAKEVFGTKEWAKHSANVGIGCKNNCIYCYSRDSYEKREHVIPWTEERVDEKLLNKKWGKREGTIMFPTSHDITEGNYEACLTVVKNILEAGNDMLIVSKPDPVVILKLAKEIETYKDKVLFRFTIGSMSNDILKFWEPDAPSFEERFLALRYVHSFGFSTSVSMEPLLDNNPSDTHNLVMLLLPYVTDSIWIGKMNKPNERIKAEANEYINGYLERQSDNNIKKIYSYFENNPKIKWKESIKRVVGLPVSTIPGEDN